MARQLSVIDDTQAPPAAPPAPAVEGERTIRIPVSGMTCAACQARVQRTLQKQPGVVDAGVNLMMHDATVRYVPDATSPEQLIEAIRATGYGAELPPAEQSAFDEQRARDEAQEHEFLELRRKAIVSGVAGAAAMLAPMALMSVVPMRALNLVLLALTLAGNAFEARAKRATSAALRALAGLQPPTARVVRESAGREEVDVPIA